jgi:hypothetical protein
MNVVAMRSPAVAMAGDAVAEVALDAFFGMLARHAFRRMLVATHAGEAAG